MYQKGNSVRVRQNISNAKVEITIKNLEYHFVPKFQILG